MVSFWILEPNVCSFLIESSNVEINPRPDSSNLRLYRRHGSMPNMTSVPMINKVVTFLFRSYNNGQCLIFFQRIDTGHTMSKIGTLQILCLFSFIWPTTFTNEEKVNVIFYLV